MKIKDLKGEPAQAILCILLLFSITFVVFQYTVEIREPWFGELSAGHHQWLSGSTLKFSKNWYREGPFNLDFALLEDPLSIESPDIRSREPYVSYPPGSVIPIYVLGEMVGHEPDASLLMGYNLFNHFLIAFLLSLMIFIFLRQIEIDLLNSFLFSTIPLLLELLLPAPLYWHQNVFFADQAVILPFVLYILLEVVMDGMKERYVNVICVLQNLVLFYGFLTDWLFIFIALTVYLKRIFEGKIKFKGNMGDFLKESFKYWLVPLLAILIFISQIYLLNSFNKVINTALFRTGMSTEGSKFIADLGLFTENFLNGYGQIGLYAIIFSLIVLLMIFLFILLKKNDVNFKIKRIWSLMAILLIPCILQVIIFSDHSAMHDFSVLKYSVPLATVPFVLLPISLYLILKSYIKIPKINLGLSRSFNVDLRLLIVFLLMFSAVSFYLVNEHPHYKEQFPQNDEYFAQLGNSIQKNTQYSDIVFSPQFEIPINPPQQLSYSMKRVYKIDSLGDIGDYTKGLSGYHVVIMFLGPPGKEWEDELSNATLIKDGNYYYYRLN